MENIPTMDEFEAFVIDFLSYRRNLREHQVTQQASYLPSSPKLLEYKPEPHKTPEAYKTPATPRQMLHTIGRGWPYYKDIAQRTPTTMDPSIGQIAFTAQGPSATQNDIIPTLTPIINQTICNFGYPTTPKALDHLVYQVIASAMTNPLINSSINTAEITPWGRVPLLQAVIELLILHQRKDTQ